MRRYDFFFPLLTRMVGWTGLSHYTAPDDTLHVAVYVNGMPPQYAPSL